MPNFSADKEQLAKVLESFEEKGRIPAEDAICLLSKRSGYDYLLISVLIDTCCSFVVPDNPEKKDQLVEALKEQLVKEKILPRFASNPVNTIRFHASQWFMDLLQKTSFGMGIPDNRVHASNFFSSKMYPNTYEQNFNEEKVIASGGFGTVCKAVHKIDKNTYAVKKIFFSIDRKAEAEKVLSEVRSISTLSHCNIVSYKNCWVQLVDRGDISDDSPEVSERGSFNNSSRVSISTVSDEDSSDSLEDEDDCLDELGDNSMSFSVDPFEKFENDENSKDSNFTVVFESEGGETRESVLDTCSSSSSSSSGKHTTHVERVTAMLCIQMEFCDWDLHHWLDKRAEGKELPFKKDVRDIFRDIVKGVVYIHSKSIIHRDLKPSNIFYSKRDGSMKIGDFGLATLSHATANQPRAVTFQSHTSNLGTFPYMAPEQKNRTDYDHKVDIYSLGVILLELLIPFKTRSEFMRVLDKYTTPPELADNFPQYVDLVDNLLQADPKKRMSAKEILDHPLLIDRNQEEQRLLLLENKSLKLLLERNERELNSTRQELNSTRQELQNALLENARLKKLLDK